MIDKSDKHYEIPEVAKAKMRKIVVFIMTSEFKVKDSKKLHIFVVEAYQRSCGEYDSIKKLPIYFKILIR